MSSSSHELGLKLLDSGHVQTINQDLVRRVFQRNSLVKLQAPSPTTDDNRNSCETSGSIVDGALKEPPFKTLEEATVALSNIAAATTTTTNVDSIEHLYPFDLTYIPKEKVIPIMPSQEQVQVYERNLQSLTIAELENTTVGELLEYYSRTKAVKAEHNSKNMFVARFVKAVLKLNISLDIAIVCADALSETFLDHTLEYYKFDPDRVKTGFLDRVLGTDVYGKMIKIRKEGKRAKTVRKPEVDFIIVRDPTAYNLESLSKLQQLFQGIIYNPPQMVYLMNMFAPEMRLLLLQQALRNKVIDWNTSYNELLSGQRCFIFEMPNYLPSSPNEWLNWSQYVAEDVALWAQESMNVPYMFNYPTTDSVIYRMLRAEEYRRRRMVDTYVKARHIKFPRGLTTKVHLEELKKLKRQKLKEMEQEEQARRAVREQERQRRETEEVERKRKETQAAEEAKKRAEAAAIQQRNAEEERSRIFRKEIEERQRKVAEFRLQKKTAELNRQKQLAKRAQQEEKDKQMQRQQQAMVELQHPAPHNDITVSLADATPSPTPSVPTTASSKDMSHLSVRQEVSLNGSTTNNPRSRTPSPLLSGIKPPGNARTGGLKFLTTLKKSTAAQTISTDKATNSEPSSFHSLPTDSRRLSSEQEPMDTAAAMAKRKMLTQVVPTPSRSTDSVSSSSSVESSHAVSSDISGIKPSAAMVMPSQNTTVTAVNGNSHPSSASSDDTINGSDVTYNDLIQKAVDTSFLHDKLSKILEELNTL